MGIFLNILVILLAVIAFLFLYNIALKKDKKSQDYHLSFNKPATDFEFGEDMGVDQEKMENESPISSFNEEKVESKEISTNNHLDELYLKEGYAKDYIRLFSRDPEYLYAYWEINNDEFFQNIPYLRLRNEKNEEEQEVEISHDSKNWYLKAKASNSYRATIGYKKDGIFYPLASSKTVYTPADRPSTVIDEHWMTIEELSKYSFRVEMDTLAMVKEIEARKIHEELEADSLVLMKE
ncbi:DUF4912 domain-containing protein [Natronospora cellulosivora (SeqCode)]